MLARDYQGVFGSALFYLSCELQVKNGGAIPYVFWWRQQFDASEETGSELQQWSLSQYLRRRRHRRHHRRRSPATLSPSGAAVGARINGRDPRHFTLSPTTMETRLDLSSIYLYLPFNLCPTTFLPIQFFFATYFSPV